MLIEKTIRNYLLGELQNIPVEVEQPKNQPDKYIVFRVIDRDQTNLINSVTVEFYCYGKDKLEAAGLDELLRDTMPGIVALDDIFSCKLGGGNDNKDDTLKRYRYRSYFNITY